MYPTAAPYFIFLVAVCLLYWLAARLKPLRLAILLLASLFFLAKFGQGCLLLVPIAATLDFLFAHAIHRARQKEQARQQENVRHPEQSAAHPTAPIENVRHPERSAAQPTAPIENVCHPERSAAQPKDLLFRLPPTFPARFFLALSLTLNLTLLITAKAFAPHLSWLFTLSLSYYCFQQLSYTIDIYRRDATPTPNFLTYLSAATFFPVITAGPINRLADLIAKLSRPFTLEEPANARALLLIATGLIKKLLIAQFLADNLVNPFLDTPKLYSGLEILIAVWGYAFQLYYDFSGYTDIAIGSALLLGIPVPENFHRPYSAANIAEFWRKWHITFSNWLRDYVYFSLPSERSFPSAKFINPIITMLLGGLWHGFGYTFLIWGALHGTMLSLTRAFQDYRKKRKITPTRLGRYAAIFLTFNFVCATWVFFRADSIPDALAVFARIASLTFALDQITLAIALYLLIALALHIAPESWFDRTVALFARTPFILQGATIALVVLALQSLAGKGAAPFAYSKF